VLDIPYPLALNITVYGDTENWRTLSTS
jgi:hypothetical protein